MSLQEESRREIVKYRIERVAYQIPAHKHDGNIQQFGLHFVKTGIVSREKLGLLP